MTGRIAPARARRQHGHGVRGAVAAAVAAVHHSRPPAGASAGEQAVWWHCTANALELLARHEADQTRALDAAADAATARALAKGLAETHTRQAVATPEVREAARSVDLVTRAVPDEALAEDVDEEVAGL